MPLHPLLERHLKRAALTEASSPADLAAWALFLQGVSRAYTEADQDRYLLERSLSLSSQEMRDLHRQLANERDALKTVMVSLAEGLCVLDSDGRVEFVNPAGLKLLGTDEASCVGARLQDLIPMQDRSGRELDQIIVGPVGGAEDEHRLIIRGDQSAFIVYSITPMAGNAGGVILTIREITERKRHEAEREDLNRKLVSASRQAGMAEVATGVLHNVGNVLNSVNVSAALADEKIRRANVAGVGKAAAMLLAHEKDLGAFLGSAQGGRQIPTYLAKLAEQLAAEQANALDELTSLRRNIEHIKEIVSTQQTYAKHVGIREKESMESLVEDALRINIESLKRHDVRLLKEFAPCPNVLVDKHHILQIVVNLLSNAKHAVQDCPADQRNIVVRLGTTAGPPEWVRLEVIDSGVGIAPENLSRIFQHGFTTRKDGHGFGLHSAALAAKSFGASLSVRSDGLGCGAVFTLDVPAATEAITP